MCHSRPIKLALLTGVLLSGLTCFGQTNLAPTIKPIERDGRVVLSEKQADELGLLPTTADRQKLPLAIKERLLRFEVSREAYLKEQEQMKKRLLGATTEAERDRIRASMREQRDAWLRRAKAMREEARERARELRTQLPSMNEVIENARENAREAAAQNRKRRGQDSLKTEEGSQCWTLKPPNLNSPPHCSRRQRSKPGTECGVVVSARAGCCGP
ncbi:MAG: hypothetical protein IPK15_10785 [Verrucomicrobia bacterium]|nr:hypothetical protein [Verrucomicrobiota bacterium]